MELNREALENTDPLALSNTITLSALVGILVRKGIIGEAELVEEIRKLRATLERG